MQTEAIVKPKITIAALKTTNNPICIYFNSENTANMFASSNKGISLSLNGTFIIAKKLIVAS